MFVHFAGDTYSGESSGKGHILGESPGFCYASFMVFCIRVSLFEIRVIIGGSFHRKLNIYEIFDSIKVP